MKKIIALALVTLGLNLTACEKCQGGETRCANNCAEECEVADNGDHNWVIYVCCNQYARGCTGPDSQISFHHCGN